jgi:hypothetical protein
MWKLGAWKQLNAADCAVEDSRQCITQYRVVLNIMILATVA